MLPVRSMMTTTSSGAKGGSPQGPLQAAETTVPVEPWLTPTARPNVKLFVTEPCRTTALQRSPRAGLQIELRVRPEPMKSAATGACPKAPLGLQTAGMSRAMAGAPLATPMRQRYAMV